MKDEAQFETIVITNQVQKRKEKLSEKERGSKMSLNLCILPFLGL